MFLKKTNGVGLKNNNTDDRKLRMIIVKDQWTAILANCVKKLVMSFNSIKKIYYFCNGRQEKTCKSIKLNEMFNSKVVALYNLY